MDLGRGFHLCTSFTFSCQVVGAIVVNADLVGPPQKVFWCACQQSTGGSEDSMSVIARDFNIGCMVSFPEFDLGDPSWGSVFDHDEAEFLDDLTQHGFRAQDRKPA